MNAWPRTIAVRLLILALTIGTLVLSAGCASVSDAGSKPAEIEKKFTGDVALPKSIYVFHDGTLNDAGSGTNVRKLFEAVVATRDPQTAALYIEGVGSTSTPLFGVWLGFGMEERIGRGYDFIAQSYRPGDAVYIFGFSRGAHSARALAGLIAYAGVPPASTLESGKRLRQVNHIIEIVKRRNDAEFLETWRSWTPGAPPPAANEIKASLNLSTRPVEINLLGVWDTVPGSSFKNFGTCKELPDGHDGDRYKSDSYPSIRKILHAVSADEKRSKFRPILLCPPINPAFTTVTEMWFPGAHADVGGGYSDSQALSNLSLQWMAAAVHNSGAALQPATQFVGDPLGLAHWSVADAPGNLGSHCQDRIVPAGAVMDRSVETRKQAGSAPLRINSATVSRPYPMSCSQR